MPVALSLNHPERVSATVGRIPWTTALRPTPHRVAHCDAVRTFSGAGSGAAVATAAGGAAKASRLLGGTPRRSLDVARSPRGVAAGAHMRACTPMPAHARL